MKAVGPCLTLYQHFATHLNIHCKLLTCQFRKGFLGLQLYCCMADSTHNYVLPQRPHNVATGMFIDWQFGLVRASSFRR